MSNNREYFEDMDDISDKEGTEIFLKERTDLLSPNINTIPISGSNSPDESPSCSVFESEELDNSVFECDLYERESGVESVDGDWLQLCQTPPLTDQDLDLTEEQALETLKYFTLSVSRANQMTKTTQDLEAVLQLLQEKEKDLELAANIGQSLLDRNKNLYKRTEALENYVNEVEERETQLKHVVNMKDQLLKTFLEDQSMEDDGYPPSESSPYENCRDESMLCLKEKCNELEVTNNNLVLEALKLREETNKEEEKEKMLVYECIKELGETKAQITHLTNDISQKNQDNIEQQEEISNLINTVLDLQSRHNELTEENSELHETLRTSQESQKDLQVEVSTLHEKYQECFEMLIENQREMKVMKEKLGSHDVIGDPERHARRQDSRESLAVEIEETVRRDLESSQDKKKHADRVMQTVRAANTKRFPKAIKGGTRPQAKMTSQSKKQDKPFDFTFAASANTTRSKESTPSMDDLRAAVRRLSISEAASSSPRPRRAWAPEKLQIVKPMEGSATLHKWQSLARPTMSGLHNVHPGVHVKGETNVPNDTPVKGGTSLATAQKTGVAPKKNEGETRIEKREKVVKNPAKQGNSRKTPGKTITASNAAPPPEKETGSSEVVEKLGKSSKLTEIVKSHLATENSENSSSTVDNTGVILKEILRSTPSVSGSLVNTMPVTTTAMTSFMPTTTTTTSTTTVSSFSRSRHVRSRSSENLLNLIKPFNQPGLVESPSIEIPKPNVATFGGMVGRLVRSNSKENLSEGQASSSLPRSSSSGSLSDLIRNSKLTATVGKSASFDGNTANKRASFHLGDSPPSPTQLEVGGFGFFGAKTKQENSPEAAPSNSSMFRAFSGLGGLFRPRSKSMDNLGPLPTTFNKKSPVMKKTGIVERSLERFNQVFGPD